MEVTNIHIGEMIKKELQKQDLTISWLARQVHQDASNLNKMLQKPSMHIDLLIRISQALHHDFFGDVSQKLQLENR